ncbi:phosphoglycerate kinase [Candidatus Pacearchaeota archaeon]|nr:phosphoglycerate kinase [Candidatus Pacearchaeota archaeon]|tara:strand:+ start:623 stop:1774 length:1152 start_codon:yes stop_codon:yes gene_type:complete
MFKGIRTLDDFNFKGKRVLVRADINSPFVRNKVENNERIEQSGKTIREIQRKGGRVVVLAHQGQPDKKDFKSLKGHVKLLNKYCKIKFVKDTLGKKAISEIDSLRSGQAILLENVRFQKDEYDPKKKGNMIVEEFKDRFDIYINDAFSVAHRDQTSIVSFPKYMDAGMGRTFEKELKNIGKIRLGDCHYLLGGNKVDDLMLLVKKKNILAAGVFSVLCSIVSGKNLGLENKKRKKEMQEFGKIIKKELGHMHKPSDFGFLIKRKRKDIGEKNWPVNARALDIGEETIKKYEKIIAGCSFVFMKGTPGNCGVKGFCLGTKRLLKAMEKSPAFCVVAGGHSSTAAREMNINEKKLGYISLSGGALVHYIAGKKLPGLEALKREKG